MTYADPSVVDKVIEDTHILDGKTVEIKRTIPRGNMSKGPKTRKIFVGGIPKAITDDEFKNYFDKFGKVVEHQIMRDRSTGQSRGFGFITFDSEQAVEEIISKGEMIEVGGKLVEIKKAEPKKPLSDAAPIYGFDSRPPYVPAGVGGFRDNYSGFGGAGYGNNQYMSAGGYGSRPGGYGEYGGSEYGRGYGVYRVGSSGGYEEDPSRGYGIRPSTYGEGFGGYGNGMTGGNGGAGDGYGANDSYNSSHVGGPYGRGGAYGSGREGYGGRTNSRYHPYSRENNRHQSLSKQ